MLLLLLLHSRQADGERRIWLPAGLVGGGLWCGSECYRFVEDGHQLSLAVASMCVGATSEFIFIEGSCADMSLFSEVYIQYCSVSYIRVRPASINRTSCSHLSASTAAAAAVSGIQPLGLSAPRTTKPYLATSLAHLPTSTISHMNDSRLTTLVQLSPRSFS